MNTARHNYDLRWSNRLIIAPRYFKIGYYTYFVHISRNCEYADIFIDLGSTNNCVNVAYRNCLKLYSNSKGLYFNFSYWINEHIKKTKKIYICE